MNDRHPGDKVLDGVLKRLPGLYAVSREKCEEIIDAFLKPKQKALQPRKNEKKQDYHMRVFEAFTGLKWRLARRKIAQALTDADMKAQALINDALEQAFADGLNESAYAMALSGVNMWPVTPHIVRRLVADGVVTLNERRLKKGKDADYNEKKTQTAVHSAAFLGVKADAMAKHVAKTIANSRMNETISAARATVYGATDGGGYFLGLEAQRMGIDVEKTWLGIIDMHIRPSHKHLHGETVPLKGLFHGYHGDLRYPHDPNADPREIMRCRCRMVVHVKGKYPSEYSRTILPTETIAYRKWRDERIKEAGGELELLKLHKRWGR